jgi:hypothetical protein
MRDGTTTLALCWQKTALALSGPLRVAYLKSELCTHPLPVVAEALEEVCAAAEQAEPGAREMLVGVVDLLAHEDRVELVQLLREEAAGRSLLSLARLLRRPTAVVPSGSPSAPPSQATLRVPDYGTGRILTLGERKALARRPTRKMLDKLLADPHPAVIRTLLGNPRLTEDDVVKLAARRPGWPEVLAEIAKSGWCHRRRVRMALVLNPDSPLERSIPLVALLIRSELHEIAQAAFLAPALRVAAHELLARRPPVRRAPSTSRWQ